MCAQLLPDHGVMPELVYDLNLLSWGTGFSMEPFCLVFEALKKEERDYMDIRKGTYSYLECFAYAAERSGRTEFIPLLAERLQTLLLLLYRALAGLGAEEGIKGLKQLSTVRCLAIRKSAEMGRKAVEEGSFDRTEKTW